MFELGKNWAGIFCRKSCGKSNDGGLKAQKRCSGPKKAYHRAKKIGMYDRREDDHEFKVKFRTGISNGVHQLVMN